MQLTTTSCPHEAKMIKSIPFCFTEAKDQMYWPGKVDGIYSVKVGYRLLIEDELGSNADPLPPPPSSLKAPGRGFGN